MLHFNCLKVLISAIKEQSSNVHMTYVGHDFFQHYKLLLFGIVRLISARYRDILHRSQ